MQCLAGICGAPQTADLACVQDSEQVGFDVACKLNANFTRVVQDITNPGPNNIDGKTLSQGGLKRVDPQHISCVREMVSALCCRLAGGVPSGPSSPEDAKVWNHAAKFLGLRLQGSGEECPGRQSDMGPAQAAEMRAVLAQFEAATLLMCNREYVVLDITNPGPTGVGGGQPSQPELARLDPSKRAAVDAMVREVSRLLLVGKEFGLSSKGDELLVWAKAAGFLGQRIQDPEESSQACVGRAPDMSVLAAGKLRTMLAKLEAAIMLTYNRERVVEDITNPGPANIDGKELTQLDLMRVDRRYKASVDEMVKAVASLLMGQGVSGPLTPDEALVWKQAATFLAQRVQGGPGEMPGRAPDMSSNAATMMRRVLGQIEAFGKLMSNRDRVIQDITNPGSSAVGGGTITQPNLKRLGGYTTPLVDAMISETCSRLLGKKMSEPDSGEARVWAEAANFLHVRIQASAAECPGRSPDFSNDAATAMRKVLASIPNPKKKIGTSSVEAAQRLMSNRERVVLDIINPGPKNIDGKPLTQTDLKRVGGSGSRMSVDAMISEVFHRLLGKKSSKPSTPEEAGDWVAAASYLSGRIQGTPSEMPGRNPDMSSEAAAAMRQVLAGLAS